MFCICFNLFVCLFYANLKCIDFIIVNTNIFLTFFFFLIFGNLNFYDQQNIIIIDIGYNDNYGCLGVSVSNDHMIFKF